MIVPSGLADSLNLPGIMGMAGAAGLTVEKKPDAPPIEPERHRPEPGSRLPLDPCDER
jgi:hypothetical protein